MSNRHRADYLKIEELEVGADYECYARNFEVGTWNGESFDYMRAKWGLVHPDTELHWDSDDHYGTVKPFKKVGD